MEKLNELLEKYFRGETSLDEEKVLKQYFASGHVAPEHEPYRPLFEAFGQEQEIKYVTPRKQFMLQGNSTRHQWIRAISFTGIAAALLVSLWVIQLPESDNYAVINGKKIENKEFVQSYAETKMQNAGNILSRSRKNIDQVKENLEPVKKVGEAKEKIQDIRNLLYTK